MKLFPLFLGVVAAVSVCSCANNGKTTGVAGADSSAAVASQTAYTGKIAFVRMDSLMNGYGMYIDMSDAFAKKQQKVQGELTAQGRSLEREAMELQEKAEKGLLTRYQGQTAQENLQKKQQNIMAYRDRVLGEMAQEEAQLSAQLTTAVMDYLKEYNATKGYSMILQTVGGTPVLLADPALDITGEVLAELNSRYEAKLSADQKK